MTGSTIFVALLASLLVTGLAAPAAPQNRPRLEQSVIVVEETGRFMAISEDGKISANGDIGSLEAHFNFYYLSENLVQIQSANPEKDCYLIHEDGEFKAGKANSDNSIFEVVQIVDGYSIALRHWTEDGKSPVCFLGFASADSIPTCYTSTDFAATRFMIYH